MITNDRKKAILSGINRPATVTVQLDKIPLEMTEAGRWVGWRWERKKDRWTKVPVSLKTGKRIDAANVGVDHMTISQFSAIKKNLNISGMGFTLGDGLAGVDLDNCRDPDTSEVDQWALEIVAICASYCEVSPTGTGLKIFGYATPEDCPPWKRKNTETGEVEIYASGRYFCVTGQVFGEYRELNPISDALRTIAMLLDDTLPRPEPPAKASLIPFTPSVNSSSYPWRNLYELVQHASTQKDGVKLAALASGDTSGHGGDASRADAAFCSKLAFYLGRDPVAVDHFFRQSGLMRPKWDQKHASDGRTYGQITIQKAISLSNETWSPPSTASVTMGSTPPRPGAPGAPAAPVATITVPDCEQFPVDALPESFADLVRHVAQVVDCETAYVAMPCLAVIAGAIGGTLCISPKRGWYETSAIWSVVIGDSGTGKSPGQAVADYVTRTINRELRDRYHQECREYNAACLDIKKDEEKPPAPRREYFAVKDITFERLAENLLTSPRGMILTKGELADWFYSFARYKSKGSGTDAARWIGCFDGEDISIERKSRDNGPRDIYIERPAISVYGGIQPDIFKEIMQEKAYISSGLAARLLLAYLPKRCPRITEFAMDEQMRDKFVCLIRIMRSWPLGQDLTPYVGLEYEAHVIWKRYTDENAERAEGIIGGPMAAVLPKMTRHSLKLALAMHAYQCAESGADPVKTSCSPDTIERAIKLAKWFTQQAERVYAMGDERTEDRELRHLVELVRRKGGSITTRDLQRANCRKYPNSQSATLALDALVNAGLATLSAEITSSGKSTERYTLQSACMTHDNA